MRRYFNQRVQILDTNGDPVPGAKLEFFEAGTANQLDTYSDFDLTTPNTNPVVCDSGGYCTVFLKVNRLYDYTTVDADDVTVYAKVLNVSSYEPPLTTKGDIFTFDTDFQRLGVGTDGEFLVADSSQATGLNWGSGSDSTLTTKGDLYTYDTANARLPVGNDGSILTVASGETTGLLWVSGQVRATNTVAQTGISQYTWTTIQFDSELQDTDSIYDNSTYTITIPAAGWYAMDVNTTSGGTSDSTQLRILVDGTDAFILSGGPNDDEFLSIIKYFTASQTIVFQWQHLYGGGTKTIETGGNLHFRRIS